MTIYILTKGHSSNSVLAYDRTSEWQCTYFW